MPARFDTVTFLSDYGLRDEFVGVVKSVIRTISPEVTVIDLTHDIDPADVRGGGLALARSVQYLCPGVVLAVVDPGVGTGRRAIAVEVGGGQSFLVGPDNGLLAPAVAMIGGGDRVVSLTNAEFHLPAPGPTFAGRDILGPVAAHLCAGVDLLELGEVIDPLSVIPGVLPVTRPEGDGIVAEVLWVDRFGNAQLNVDPDEIDAWGTRVRLRLGLAGDVRIAQRSHTYQEIPPGGVGLVVDSYGLMAIAVDRGSAAAQLALAAGDQVVMEPPGGSEDALTPAIVTPVSLRDRGHGATR
jgi:S-adenosyl-L-methionine hydrolase (adenosine-forming)